MKTFGGPVRTVIWRSAVAMAALTVVVWAGCGPAAPGAADRGIGDRTVRAVATTGMIADIVAQIGGDRVDVTALMGPGIDPHLYRPSEGDVRTLAGADIIFYNGLNLEGRMGDLFVKMSAQTPTIPVSDGVAPEKLREPPEFAGHYDPHIWFDVRLWIDAVRRVEKALSDIDPEHAALYRQRAAAYVQELEELDRDVQERIAEIPEAQRVLVTAHDAFGYLGARYGLEVVGLQGISTAADYGVQDVRRLVDLVVERKIPAIFVETSVPERSIEAVIQGARDRGHQVRIGGALYSDALGEPGTPAGTYIGMVRHNVDTIVEALK